MFGCIHLYVHRGQSRWPDVLVYHSLLYAFETEPHSCQTGWSASPGALPVSAPQWHCGYRHTYMPSFVCVECGLDSQRVLLHTAISPVPVSYFQCQLATGGLFVLHRQNSQGGKEMRFKYWSLVLSLPSVFDSSCRPPQAGGSHNKWHSPAGFGYGNSQTAL